MRIIEGRAQDRSPADGALKVLFLTKYGPLAASTRHRYVQFLPALRQAGIEGTVSPLLDDDYLRAMFDGRRSKRAYLRALLGRVRAILGAARYDTVVIHCEAYPYAPAILEWGLRQLGGRYLYDADDAVFHQYDHHRNPLVRRLLGHKIRDIVAGASGVIAGNQYLASYARQVNPRVAVIPTVVDTTQYLPRSSPRVVDADRRLVVGWIGSPSTAAYLMEMRAALADFCARWHARVVLIGSGPIELPGVPLEVRAWSEATEVADLQSFDIGIMPLPDTPWARGKCGFKLIQYMACGLPVIASPVGVNVDIVEPGVNGLLAGAGPQWTAALETLASDPDLRARLGRNGRSKVIDHYSLSAMTPRLIALLHGDFSVAEPAAGPMAALG